MKEVVYMLDYRYRGDIGKFNYIVLLYGTYLPVVALVVFVYISHYILHL